MPLSSPPPRSEEPDPPFSDVTEGDVVGELKKLSRDGLGVGVAIEAVGMPATFTTALDSIRPTLKVLLTNQG
jgi:threonine dehydrogenase-like Zn-dependent dehydrogenase